MTGKSDKVIIALSLAILISLFGWASNVFPYDRALTGSAISVTPTSQVNIQKYFSINASGNLSYGIDFGTIESLPANNWNATKNWNYTGGGDVWHNETLYWITVEMDSNTPVDLCIITDALNTSGGDEIGIGNYTFSDSGWNNITYPGPIDHRTMSTAGYVAGSTNISVGGSNYFRFWLDVPISTASGTYNNTVTILGVSNGVVCP